MSGDELRRRRTALNLTQAVMADRLGLTRQAIYAWEHEINPVPVWMEFVLLWFEHERALGVDQEGES